jgi:polysaccharide deacetylase family protein (PEP-CTERM system associated)
MIKVLHIVEYLYQGGIERLLEQFASCSNSKSLEVEHLFFAYEMDSFRGMAEQIRQQGKKVFIYKKAPGHDNVVVKKISEIVKEEGVSIIHTHDFGPTEYAVRMKIKSPWLKLVHTHHTIHHFIINPKYRFFFQFASYFYNKIITVSDFVQDTLKESCPRSKNIFQTIYNGVDPDHFKKCSNEAFLTHDKLRLINISRISKEKNLIYLLKTCKKLKEQNIDFVLHHVGSGTKEAEKEVHDFIHQHHLEKDIILHGFCEDVTPILKEADIFISSSLTEGHPVAVLEAMASSKVCFCSDIPAHRLLPNKVINFFDLTDDNALIYPLKNFYNNLPRYQNMVEHAKKEVEKRFSIDRMLNEYGTIYKTLVIKSKRSLILKPIALSFDIEDWFCVRNMKELYPLPKWENLEPRVIEPVNFILTELKNRDIKATFFTLGWIAEKYPELVKKIAADGHEIATHGYSHKPIDLMGPSEFEEDLKKSIQVLESITNKKIRGFRAPSFSVTKKTYWALSVMKKCGIEYDSSIYPTKHPDYGISDFPQKIQNIQVSSKDFGEEIVEYPLTSFNIFGKKLPISGGGYFRLYPYWLSSFLLRRVNRKRDCILYFHPWEFDYYQPRIKLPLTKKFRHYVGLKSNPKKFKKLLRQFKFTTVENILKNKGHLLLIFTMMTLSVAHALELPLLKNDEKSFFKSHFVREETNDAYVGNFTQRKILFTYRNHRRDIFWPYQSSVERAIDLGVDLESFEGKHPYYDFDYSGSSFLVMSGFKNSKNLYIDFGLGLHALKEGNKGHAFSSPKFASNIKFKKGKFYFLNELKYDLVYQEQIFPAGIDQKMRALTLSPQMIYRFNSFLNNKTTFQVKRFSDNNEKREVGNSTSLSYSTYTYSLGLSYDVSYKNYRHEKESYHNPGYTLAPTINFSYYPTEELGLETSYSVSRSKDLNENLWSSEYTFSADLFIGNREEISTLINYTYTGPFTDEDYAWRSNEISAKVQQSF